MVSLLYFSGVIQDASSHYITELLLSLSHMYPVNDLNQGPYKGSCLRLREKIEK